MLGAAQKLVLTVTLFCISDEAQRITCQNDAVTSNCAEGVDCWVTCPDRCSAGVMLYGTEVYRDDTPICTAAIHDQRVNRTHRTVAFQLYPDVGHYLGSWRNGIKTQSFFPSAQWPWKLPLCEPHAFKVKPVLDLTSVHVRYRFGQNERHVQVCFAPPGQIVEFTHFGWIAHPHASGYMDDGVFKNDWISADGGQYLFGAFVCSVRDSVLTSATSVAMGKTIYFPTVLSQTISVNEEADIQDANGGRHDTWWKDGDIVSTGHTIQIRNAQVGNGGHYAFRQGSGYMQSSRLIVRACPNGRYGDECQRVCPPCLNGGVCHDITGVCVCPPGFRGEHCEGFCNAYHFGKNCTHNCTELSNLARGDPSCRGMLFCLPDPYGCSCYPGFRGVDCTDTCPPGTYGADCKQRRSCHCQNGTGCHPQWGVCTGNSCEEGYRDPPSCEQAYPVLKTFYVNVIDDTSISVEWQPWSPETGDNGVGEPDGYIVQFKEQAANTWNRTDIIRDTGNGTLSDYITELKPNTKYSVQVLVHDVSGHVHSQRAPTARVRTQCGAPLSSPSNFSHKETTDGMVKVTWQLPERSQWQCDVVSVEVQIDDGAPQDSTRTTDFTFRTKPFTAYRIQARLKTTRGVGPWSDPYKFTTPEEAPGQMSIPSNERLSARTYKLRWQPPSCSQRHSAAIPPAIIPVFHNLTASAVYNVSIRATTVKDGPWKDDRLVTSEEVPEAAPQRLTAIVRARSAEVSWQPPDCTKVNGQVTAYHILRTSTAKWASNELSTTLRDDGLEMTDLVPFTEYNITVSAENSAGVGPTAELSFRTAPSVPPAPTNLTVYSASSEHLALSWLPPYPPYGMLERYTNKRHVRVMPMPEAATTALSWHRLFPKMQYHVIVIAKNKDVHAWSQESNLVTAETRESKPGPPSHVMEGERNETEVIISWKEPSFPNGVILGYRVTLKNQQLLSSENNISMEVPADGRQVQFSNLTPGTAYVAQVEARTSVGYGELVEISVHTRPSLPVIATKVELKDVDDTAITLQLKRPDSEPDNI
ncbi:hypothetical protein MTO96_030054, partial [Rhipicephalus appendiculatus]